MRVLSSPDLFNGRAAFAEAPNPCTLETLTMKAQGLGTSVLCLLTNGVAVVQFSFLQDSQTCFSTGSSTISLSRRYAWIAALAA